MSPREIYEKLTSGKGSALLDLAREVTDSECQREEERATRIRKLSEKVRVGWQGESGDAAFGAARPLARTALRGADQLSTSQDLLGRQSGSFHEAANSVRPVPAKPPEDPLGDLPWIGDIDAGVRAYQADAQHNIDVYRGYDRASEYNETNMPREYRTINYSGGDISVSPAAGTTAERGPGGPAAAGSPAPQAGEPGLSPAGPGSGGSGSGGSSGGAGTVPVGWSPVGGSQLGQTSPHDFRPPPTGPLPGGYQPPAHPPSAPSGGAPVLPGLVAPPGGGTGHGPGGFGRGGVERGPGWRPGGSGPGNGGPGGGGTGGGAGGGGGAAGRGPGAGALAAEEAARRGSAGGAGTGRSGAGAMGAPLGAGQGRGDDDTEHQRKVLLQADPEETFGTDVLTAPQVIGDDRYEQ